MQNGISQLFFWTFAAMAILLTAEAVALFRAKRKSLDAIEGFTPILDLNTITGLTVFFVFVGLILGLAYTGENPFVYFQF